ncbi:MAG TPA: hypothetical protein VGB55_09210 [Tepidisphaeraceae bacterium]|jgi:4-amino-4-deoxy-L-arabinose transferase-like glycosyltransferase
MFDTLPPPVPRLHRSLVIALLVIALALRLGWGLSRPSDEASLAALPDQSEYLQLARNLLQGRVMVFYDSRFADTVAAYRMPGYPLFLAACGGNIVTARVAQAVIDTSIVLAVLLLARRAGIDRLQMGVAAALVAFHPYLIYFSATLLSETLFAAMLAWAMVCLSANGRWRTIVGVVLLLGSVYVRPSAIALPVVVLMTAALVRPTLSRGSFWRLGPGAMAILLTALILLPWAWRNRQVTGHWVFTTTNSGVTLYDGLNPRADGSSDQSSFSTWPELKFMGEVERSNYLGAIAKEYAQQHPWRAAELAGRKLLRFWSPIPLSAQYGRSVINLAAGLLIVGPLLLLAAVGLWRGRMSRSLKLFLLAPALYFSLVHAMTIGSLRYRVPIDVPLAVLAGAGVMRRKSVEA